MVDEVSVGGHAVPLPTANSVIELSGYRLFAAGCGIRFSLPPIVGTVGGLGDFGR